LISGNHSATLSEAPPPRVIAGEGTPESEWRNWDGLDSLPDVDLDVLIPPGSRVMFVAPHPDDEVLGMGGLMALLAQRHHRLALVAVTDGDASHRDSAKWPVDRLRTERPRETLEALRRLGMHGVQLIRMHIGDGGVANAEEDLRQSLAAIIGPTDVVITTWSHDGHPDHEATGRAADHACIARGATLVEVPVWMWHWSHPGDVRVPWKRARRLVLDAPLVEAKRHAAHAFVSQLEDDPSTGRPAILPPFVLDRLLRSFEVLFV
jgi:LmbE family N-acetylglucosaminyl deacetylase